MVDLPSVPRRLVTTEAPRSTVTAADAAAPYHMLSTALEQTAGAVDNLAVKTAHDQALKAVTRDENGDLKIEEMPLLLGRAGEEYKRVAQQSYNAQLAPEMQGKITENAIKNEGNPGAFSEWGRAYIEEMAARQPTAELQHSVRLLATQQVGEAANGLILRQGRRALDTAQKSIGYQQQSIENDLQAMLRGGLDENAEAFKSRMADWDRLQADRRANPAFGYSQPQADYERQDFLGKLAGQHFLYQVDRIANDASVDDAGQPKGGIDAALRYADSILSDPNIKLDDAKRHQFWSRANSELRALKAERTQNLKDARDAASALNLQSATGQPITPDQVESVAASLRKAGDPGGAARLYASFARKPLNDDFGRQPIVDQTAQLAAVKAGHFADSPNARAAYQFFTSRGYTPEQASGIVGNLLHESGLSPTITHDGGTGLGIAGWRGDRLKALKAFAAARGTAPTDLQTQLEFVDRELQTSEADAMRALKAAKTPQEAAAAIVRFERPLNYDPNNVSAAHGFANRVGLSRAVSAVNSGQIDDPSLAKSPAGGLWLQKNRALQIDKTSTAAWDVAMKDWDEKKIRPADATVNQIVDAARVSGNVALLDRVAHDMGRVDLVQGVSGRPLPEQEAALGTLNAAASAGTLSPGQAPILRDLQQRHDAIVKGLNDNPVATTVANFPDRLKQPAPLDVADSAAFKSGLQTRARIAQFGAANWQVPTLGTLDAADLAAVRAALDAADPPTKARIFADMTTALPETSRNATFAKLGEKGPAAMVDAYAGALYGRDPEAAGGIVAGWSAIKADKRFDPAEKEKDFAPVFDRLLPATAFGIGGRTSDTGALATIKNAARAIYAYRSAQVGDTSGELNETRLKEAVDAATGGVLRHNGGALIAPARGMSQSQFDGVLAGLTDTDLTGVTTLGGAPVTADYLRNSAKLESVRDGRYLVLLGNDAAKPIYALSYANTESPTPFVLDLRGKQPPTGSAAERFAPPSILTTPGMIAGPL